MTTIETEGAASPPRRRPSLRFVKLEREIDGVKLTLQVSPCSWMYRGYGLQVAITMDGGVAYILDKSTPFESATPADLERLFDNAKTLSCSCCGKPAFDPEACDTNREGKCEACFMRMLNAEFARGRKKALAAALQLRARKKKAGFTYLVNAWIHPEEGGDDFEIHLWYRQPPDAQSVETAIRKAGSEVFDDFLVVQL